MLQEENSLMIKAVIFDLDGVIVHTDKLHYLAWKHIADQEGIYFDETINNRLRGVSRLASFEIILERATKTYSLEEKVRLITEKNGYYLSLLETLSPRNVETGVLELLHYLKAVNVKVAIGSSSQNARFILSKLNLSNYFAAISDGLGLVNPKPHPEVFLKAASLLNLDPHECIVVEDAKAGIEAAVAGGFVPLGIGDASGYEKAAYSIKNLVEIIDIIKALNT